MCIYLHVCLICICGLTGINWAVLAWGHSCRFTQVDVGWGTHSRWISHVVSSWYWRCCLGVQLETTYQGYHVTSHEVCASLSVEAST